MRIRRLETSEHGGTRALYEEVFSEDSISFVDYYYKEKTKDNQIYVLEEDGAIRSMIHLNPYEMYVNGQVKKTHYIVAVATQEEYRKRGYMGALLKRILQDMHDAGEAFTFLMPAADAIYFPYDFRTVYEQEKPLFDPRESLDAGLVAEEVKPEELQELSDSATSYLRSHYQVFAIRSRSYYERLVKEYAGDGGRLMVYKRNNEIVDCRPQVAESEGTNPKIMVRILHLERMLLALKLNTLAVVCFSITDPIIAENNRCIVLTGTEFSGVMIMDGKQENSEGTITISALTELVFGRKSVEEVCLEEGVVMTVRMKEELGKLIPLSDIYINETV